MEMNIDQKIQSMKEEYINSKNHILYEELDAKINKRWDIIWVIRELESIWYDFLSWDQQAYYNNLIFQLFR